MKLHLRIPVVLITGMTLFLVSVFGGNDKIDPVKAQGPDGPDAPLQGPFVSEAVTPHIVNVDLRSLPGAASWQVGNPVREIPRRAYARPGPETTYSPPARLLPDPLLALQERAPRGRASSAFSAPALNFEGISFTGALPPDTAGDVGPNHYIQMVNSNQGARAQIFDKSGVSLAGPFELDTLWTAGGACTTGRGDPIVLYDRLADRWLLSEFADVGNHLCVYVSQTSNPVSGGWYLYDFPTPNFPDYPKYAVWPDAYYVSSNESGGPAVYALDRNQMLGGGAATFQRFTAPGLTGFGFQAFTPGDLDGAAPPAPGAPNVFMRHRDDEAHNPGANNPVKDYLELWEFHVDWATPANSTFAKTLNIPVAEFDSDLCGLNSFECFPQPGTTVTLDPLREVLMWRLQYRNFGSYQSLVGNLVTDVDGTDHGGIRWFELRRTGGGAWSLFQEGTYAPDAAHRWMGSIAMDGSGNIALGYSVSDATSIYPSIRYAGRLANDPIGALPQGEYTIINGAAAQTSGTRWGDYSTLSVDPADDCTFWYTNEYAPAGGNWRTRIAAFKFDECGAPDFALSATPSPLEICAPGDAVYTVSLTSLRGFSNLVTLNASGYPSGTSVTFGANPMTPANPPATTTLTIGSMGMAATGRYTINVTGVTPTRTHTSTVRLDVVNGAPGNINLNLPADGADNVSFAPDFNWSAAVQSEHYYLEVATDAGFNNVVYSATVTATSHTAANALSAGTLYYWRVTADNICGAGNASTPFSFTVQASTLVCNVAAVDFEAGIPADWTVVDNTGGSGIVWGTTADSACDKNNLTTGSGQAACADSDAAGENAPPYDTELISPPFDLTGISTATLSAAAYYKDLGAGNDAFEVALRDGSGWVNLLSWDENHVPEDITFDLSAYAERSNLQIRFRYSGDGWDWHAQVDDVSLACNLHPVANDNAFSVAQNSQNTLFDVLANDINPDSHAALSIIAVGIPNQGGNAAAADENGDPALPGKRIVYTPAADFTGIEVFTYTISDGVFGDTAGITVSVLPPDLTVIKRVEGAGGGTTNLPQKSTITYTITLSNTSPAMATGVVLTDTLPVSITFGGWVVQGGAEYHPGGGTVQLPGGSANLPNETITWGPVAGVISGTPQTFVFTAAIDSDAGSVITNRAWYTSVNAGWGWSNEAIIAVQSKFLIYLPVVMKQ